MTTGILILNFNHAAATVNCIESIEQFNTAPVKYIVVDNGSTKEGTVETLDAWFRECFTDDYVSCMADQMPDGPLPRVTFVRNPVNGGYAVGNNIGLEQAYKDPEITDILLLNNDILFIEDIIPTLKADADAAEKCGLITPLLYTKGCKELDDCCARKFIGNWNLMVPFLLHRRNWHGWISKSIRKQKYLTLHPELLDRTEPFPIDFPSGSCMFIPKESIREAGGFDPDTFLYYEEVILYKRLKAVGCQSYCDPRLRVHHLGGSSTKMSAKAFLQKCNLESADVYFRKYGNCTPAQKLVWSLTRAAWRFRLKMKQRVQNKTKK